MNYPRTMEVTSIITTAKEIFKLTEQLSMQNKDGAEKTQAARVKENHKLGCS